MNHKYTKSLLEPLVQSSYSVSQVVKKLGLKKGGGTHLQLTKKFVKYGIDTSHFKGQSSNLGKFPSSKKSWQEILVLRTSGDRQRSVRLRRALIEFGRPYKCECGSDPIWKGKELRFQVDHINRNTLDDRPRNLRFLCPNCHSQTEGYNGSKGLTDLMTDSRGQRVRNSIKQV